MLNTKEMKQVIVKLPDSLKEHVLNALFEVQWFSSMKGLGYLGKKLRLQMLQMLQRLN